MKNIFKIFFFLFSIFCFSQTQEQKIESILNINNMIDSYKSYLYDYKLELLKDKDSLAVEKLKLKYNDEVIKMKILKSFSETYSTEEIDKIYEFYNSSVGKKFISNYATFDQKIKDNFGDLDNDIYEILSSTAKKNKEEDIKNGKNIPIPIDKEDGFYEVIQYGDIADLKSMKLANAPSVKLNQIIEISKNYDVFGNIVINLELNEEGKKVFKKLTSNNIGKPIAIVLNKTLISAPLVNEEIPSGKIQISGNFTIEEAEKFTKLKK